MRIETSSVLGIQVARMTMEQVLDWTQLMIEQKKPRHIITANPEIIYKARKDPGFQRIAERADLLTADGTGVVWASRVLGAPVPERVTGIDLLTGLLQRASEKNWRVYFLGAKPEIVEKAVLNVLSSYPMLKVAGYHHGYFSQEENQEVVANIIKTKPDLLFVALGVPKQEEFIFTYLKDLNVPVSLGVGGSFDVLAGVAARAPLWMQKRGLEWLYRLCREPWRIKRMRVLPKFASAVLKEKIGSRR